MSEESPRYGIDPNFFEDAIVQPSGIDWECAVRPELLEYLGFSEDLLTHSLWDLHEPV